MAGQVDPDRGVDRTVPDLAVADLDVDRIDEDRGVDLLQRPRGPFGHLGHDFVGDPRDRVPGRVAELEVETTKLTTEREILQLAPRRISTSSRSRTVLFFQRLISANSSVLAPARWPPSIRD